MSHYQPLSLEPSFLEMGPGFNTQQQPQKAPLKNPALHPCLPLSLVLQPQTQNQPNLQPPIAGSLSGPGLGPAPPHEWIPPPAQLATVNSDAIDLNDEVFFNYNSVPLYTTDAFSLGTELAELAALLLLLLTANFEYNYTAALPQHDLATSPLKYTSNFDTPYTHRRRFLLAVEQLNRMSLRAPSTLKLPSPDIYSVLADPHLAPEERTVNPQHILGGNDGHGAVGANAIPHLELTQANIAPLPTSEVPESLVSDTNSRSQIGNSSARSLTRYILPSSVLSPSLSTFFTKHNSMHGLQDLNDTPETAHAGLHAQPTENTRLRHSVAVLKPTLAADASAALNNPLNPYVMNDECVSAITYWLNNTADVILEKPTASTARNPTGVMKPGWARRNSIQVVSPRTEDGPSKAVRAFSIDQKRRRRKSVNNSSIPEVSLPAGLSLSLNQVQTHTQGQVQAQFLHMILHEDHGMGPLSVPPRSFMLPLSVKREDKLKDVIEGSTFDPMDVSVPDVSLPPQLKPIFPENENENPCDHHVNLMDVDENCSGHNSGLDHGHNQGPDMGDDEPKPFPCPDCEKQFKRLEHLKRHIRSVHSNIRPFHCKYCEKKFLRSDNLAQHLKTHFKMNANGTTTIIYGNPNPQGRGGGRKKSSGDADMEKPSQLKEEE